MCLFLSEKQTKKKNGNLFFCLADCARSLADVLSCEDHVAGPTPEAADVPLFLQRQEGLTLLDLVPAARTVCRRQEETLW